MKWSDEQVDKLINLWSVQRKNLDEIAEILGTTRNAVSGKLFRLDLLTVSDKSVVKSAKRAPGTITVIQHDNPVYGRYSILDLKPNSCRFLFGSIGKPDFGYCGRETKDGSSYCSTHHEKCYRKAQFRRKKK